MRKIVGAILVMVCFAGASALAQPAPNYATIVAAPDRSAADRKLDANRAPRSGLRSSASSRA